MRDLGGPSISGNHPPEAQQPPQVADAPQDYTIADLRNAIPAHCFARSAARGLFHVLVRIVAIVVTFVVCRRLVNQATVPWQGIRTGLWAIYTVLQGLNATSLWILAHECGHQALSPYRLLNDSVGWFIHSAMLVPYFSFKMSHAKHHRYNAHLQKDVVFVPLTQEEYYGGSLIQKISHLAEEVPVVGLCQVLAMLSIGWPAYLVANVNGQRYDRAANHFDWRSPLFSEKDAIWVLISDAGCLVMLAFICYLSVLFGVQNMLVWYWAPYLWVNHWVAAITYLQHTSPGASRYSASAWSFKRGAASTFDRDAGVIGRLFFYNALETHVLHHHCPRIAFYHAQEATRAIAPLMGVHYRREAREGLTQFWVSLWRTAKECRWVKEGERKGVFEFGPKQ